MFSLGCRYFQVKTTGKAREPALEIILIPLLKNKGFAALRCKPFIHSLFAMVP
jgi:hypothetical protein